MLKNISPKVPLILLTAFCVVLVFFIVINMQTVIVAVLLCFVPCYFIYSIFDYLKARLEMKSRVVGANTIKNGNFSNGRKENHLKRMADLYKVKTDLTKFMKNAKEVS